MTVFNVSDEEIMRRWENYRKANADFSQVRAKEIKETFLRANPKEGEVIWEVGTGNGNLTFLLAEGVGQTGKVITTDVNPGNIEFVKNRNKEKSLNIDCQLLPLDKNFLEGNEYENKFDAIVTLASFHHFDNRIEKTGESGRKKALNIFHKNIKSGGKLVIADVLYDTITQKYFDAIDNPVHAAPLGHPHDFPTKERLIKLTEEAGFQDVQVEKLYTPWQFSSEEEARNFIHTLHNAKCTPEESVDIAKKYLGFKKIGDHFELGWELFYLVAFIQ